MGWRGAGVGLGFPTKYFALANGVPATYLTVSAGHEAYALASW